jgi:hypothetical protein
MIIEAIRNMVVLGCGHRAYEDNIEQVERFAFERLPARRNQPKAGK